MNESAIREAINGGQRIDSYDSVSQLRTMLHWKICDAMKLRGQSGVDNGMIDTMEKKIADVLIRDYPSLTDKEVELMLEAGISGELGKETWVSGASMLQWLRAYNRHVSRLAIIDEQTEETKKKHRMTKAEVDELNKKAFENAVHFAFDYYRESGKIFGPDDRAFHLPQWASMVYEHYRESGKIPKPSDKRIIEAGEYADRMLIEHATKREYIPAAKEDWINSYLLEQYFSDVINKRL